MISVRLVHSIQHLVKKIRDYIKSISPDKSTTELNPLRVFKAILPILLQVLLPDSCKIASNVTPIHKSEDPNEPYHYSPILIYQFYPNVLSTV